MTDLGTMGPYGRAAWLYRHAGWAGVLPLPPNRKGPPPAGFTGWAGVEPSGADIQAWIDGGHAAGNIALHLGAGLYGLDVDAYKGGGAALEKLVEQYGPLPATWVVTSRSDGSGIRMFRAELAPGRVWVDQPAGVGAGIEAIHKGHRYAVTWPSVHPDTGLTYQWWRTDGDDRVPDGWTVPPPGELPELPAAWVEALSRPGEVRTGDAAGHEETVSVVTGWREGESCPRVAEAAERAMSGLRNAKDGAALHPASTAGIHELVNLGHEGHAGAKLALAEHYSAHVEIRAARGDAGGEREWWRLVRGAVGKLAASARREHCDCDLWAGKGVTVDDPEMIALAAGVGVARPDDPFADPAPVTETGEPAPAAGEAQAGELDPADRLIARMVGPSELRDRPAPAWLIEGLLTVDSAAWLIAAPASYKSFVALDWAGHVASGKPWMGRTVAPGGVLYVVAEGAGGMGPRIRAWEHRNGPMSDQLRFLPMPVQAARPDQWAVLVEAARRIKPALIVLDTQARITVGIDENDNSAMGEFVEAIEQLRRATCACVLVVHHLGRNGTHARGASAIDGAQDTELRLTRTADLRGTLRIDKSKNSADDLQIDVELERVEFEDGGSSLAVVAPLGPGWVVAEHVANLAENQAILMQVMVDVFPAMGATKAELKSEVKKRSGRGGKPMSESSFRRAWDALCDRGLFDPVGGLSGKYRYSPETGDQS